MAQVKEAANTNPSIKKDIASLSKNADKLLNVTIPSVVDKVQRTPCGNKHEYMSMASYFWPDPSKPGGVPYMRKDGQRNPDNEKVSDHKAFGDLISDVTTLSWAYYFTGNEKYSSKAVSLLRFWFLDTATFMLPNLNHAQIIMGVDTGRGIGIIDVHNIPELIDALGVLERSPSFTKADNQCLHTWFADFLKWLNSSTNGLQEFATKNNHKTFYETLTASLAMYVGDEKQAKLIFTNAKNLLASQIEPDGKQPLELERTNALSYSTFNLVAWFRLATLAANRGVDLWSYQSEKGGSIKKAIEFIKPFALSQQKFEYQQIGKYDGKEFYGLMDMAAAKLKDDSYKQIAEQQRNLGSPLNDLLNRYTSK